MASQRNSLLDCSSSPLVHFPPVLNRSHSKDLRQVSRYRGQASNRLVARLGRRDPDRQY